MSQQLKEEFWREIAKELHKIARDNAEIHWQKLKQDFKNFMTDKAGTEKLNLRAALLKDQRPLRT